MNSFFHAVAFLTRIPVPRLSDSVEDWQKSAPYFPIVGLIIGGLLWGAAEFSRSLLPSLAASVAILVFWVYITGALHLDGWMDLADGLGSHRSKDDMLRIMKDSRVGAMGVISAILLILVKVTAIYEITALYSTSALLLAPLASRFALVAAIWHWPYISEKGIGTGLKRGLNGWKVSLGLLITLAVFSAAGGLWYVSVLLISFASAFFFVCYVIKRLGGLTGDCYGALVEWTEANILLFFIILGRWLG